MNGLSALWNTLLTTGVPPFYVADNPRVYPFILGAIAFSVVLTVVMLIRKRSEKSGMVAQLGYLAGELVAIYLAWLGFSTPVYQIFGFGPDGFAGGAAVVVHGFLALTPVALALLWDAQADIGANSLWTAGMAIVVAVALVAAFEIQAWPADLVVTLEALVSYVVILAISILVTRLPEKSAARKILTGIVFAAWSVALIAVLIRHAAQTPLVALCGIYLALIWFDGLAGTFSDWHPRRWIVTVPLALAIGVLGAANLFSPLLHTKGFTFDVWLEATGASAVFLWIAPLMDSLQSELKKQADAEGNSAKGFGEQVAEIKSHWLRRVVGYVVGLEEQIKRQLQEAAEAQRLHSRAALMLQHLVEELNGITAAIFFFLLIAYYLIVEIIPSLPDPITLFRPLFGPTLVAFAGYGLNYAIRSYLTSGRLFARQSDAWDAVTHAALKPVYRALGSFGIVIGWIYGLLEGVHAVGSPTQGDPEYEPLLINMLSAHPDTAGIAPLTLLSNAGFWVAACRVIFGVALVLIVCGQARFLSHVDAAQKTVAGSGQPTSGSAAPPVAAGVVASPA